ncbi:FixG Ig-like domain-containing protein, partial [Klebsiella pneumoniae]
MKAYTALLTVLTIVMSILVITRKNVDTHITRVKGQLYQEVGNDSLSNLFDAKVLNKTRNEFNVEMKLEDLAGEVKMVNTKETML